MALAAAWCLAAQSAAAQRVVSVTVTDHLGLGQVDESITVYLAGKSAGTLHVSGGQPDDSLTAVVPDMPTIDYALCGKLVTADGSRGQTPYRIDNGGTLSGFAGQRFGAVTLGNTLFSLVDPSGAGRSTVVTGPRCSAAIS